ncbi:MAG: chemotaxis protein CheX [Oligoflexia bacterium]|nr:chemotaxis protein CheX [Oligoflexia bacterium]
MNSKIYKKTKHNDFILIHLIGSELPQSVPEEFIDWVKEILQSPFHVIVNCFVPEYVPMTWFGLFSILTSQLNDTDKKFSLIYVSPKLIESCSHTDFKVFQIKSSLREAIADLYNARTTKTPMTTMRAFVKSIISTLFIQVNTPLIRQKAYVKRKASDVAKLNGDISGWVLVQSEEYFYYLAISCSEQTFLKLMSAMLAEDYFEISKEIINGLPEIVNIVLGQVKKTLASASKISYSIPQVHRGHQAPNKEITFKDQKITSFKGGETIVIPFQSNKGEVYIELWYLKEYEEYLLR